MEDVRTKGGSGFCRSIYMVMVCVPDCGVLLVLLSGTISHSYPPLTQVVVSSYKSSAASKDWRDPG